MTNTNHILRIKIIFGLFSLKTKKRRIQYELGASSNSNADLFSRSTYI